MSTVVVFSVQDSTGTVVQVTVQDHPVDAVAVGDTGTFEGIPFTVTQVLDTVSFSISNSLANPMAWPSEGEITWVTGANTAQVSDVIEVNAANAYVSPAYFLAYHQSRGNTLQSPIWDDETIRAHIVRATDYLDQKYRYKGIKLVQTLGSAILDPNLAFIDPILYPSGVYMVPFLAPSTTFQQTEWPRQGVVDYSGDTVRGIPSQIAGAAAELALRSLNGTELQPDYDPDVVSAGGILASHSVTVGPISESKTYDTKAGLGFFASFPQIDRMLSKAGLLMAGGGRTILR